MEYFLVQLWLLRNINIEIEALIFLPFLKYKIFNLKVLNDQFELGAPRSSALYQCKKKFLLLKILIKSQL